MKVTEQTQNRIVLMGSPLMQMAAGGAFIAVALVFAVTFLQRGAPVGVLASLPFVGLGIYQLITARRVTVTADRSLGTVSIAWRSLLASGEGSVGIATIDRIAYREFTSEYRDKYGRHTRRDSTSSLVLTDGTAVLLDREQDSSSRYSFSLPISRDRSADKELAMFLGVAMIDNGIVVVEAQPQAVQVAQAAQDAQPTRDAQPTQAAQPPQTPSPAPPAQAAPATAAPAPAAQPGPATAQPAQAALRPTPVPYPAAVTLPGQAMVTPDEHPPWLQ